LAAGIPADHFAAVTEHHLDRLVQAHPETAVFLGVPDPPPGLPAMDADAIRGRLRIHQDWLTALQALEPDTLTPVQRLDAQVFGQQFELYRYLHEDLARWRHNPDVISSLGELFFVLLVARRADESARFEDVLSRLQAVPTYLVGARARMGVLDSTWTDIADRVAERMAALWTSVVEAAEAAVGGTLAAEVSEAAARAAAAVHEYRAWMADAPRQDGLWVLSDDAFAGLIERKQLGMTPAEIRELGQYYLDRYRGERAALAEQVCPGGTLAEARLTAAGTVPDTFDEVLRQVQELVVESRAFVAERGIAALPDAEEMDVIRTPGFFEPLIPFAAMLEAGVYAPLQRSVYLVTPPADGDLSRLARSRFSGIAVHEGYPGHHLQHTLAHGSTSVYRNNPFMGFPADGAARYGLDLVEGWAHYCEEMMKDCGFHDTPHSRFWMVEDQLFRAVRILVDVDLSRGKMSPQHAVDLLMSESGMGPRAAEAEVRRYTTSATYQLCYLLGKHKIEQLRDDVCSEPGDDLRAFHDLVLAEGCVPVEVLHERFRRREGEGLL